MDNPIRKAAENLKGNWFKGYYYALNDHSRMCGIGHLQTAVFGSVLDRVDTVTDTTSDQWVLYNQAYEILNKVVGEQYPERMIKGQSHFPNFNDDPNTTEDEVIAVLEKAAVRFDEQI